MISEIIFLYVVALLTSFLTNLTPVFAPPTWIVLFLYKVNNPELNSVVLALFGVVGSVAGRFVMYLYSKILGKHIPERFTTNTSYLREIMGKKRRGLFLGSFAYSLSPFPSNFLFIGSGISGIEVLPILGGFAVGRTISYASLVYGFYKFFTFLETSSLSPGIDNMRLLGNVVGILAAVSIIFVNWRRVFDRVKNAITIFSG
jgi:membrane protein YqaA with SNARE-associated domain